LTTITETQIWQDLLEVPDQLQRTLDANEDAIAAVADLLTLPGTRRLVATGNGASYYVAQTLWLASMTAPECPVDVVAIPGGLVARRAFQWRPGDALLAISSSGEFRDVIEAIEDPRAPSPFAAVTASADSTLGQAAGAVALVENPHPRAVTHTQAYCGAVVMALAVLAHLTQDSTLRRAVSGAPDTCQRAIDSATNWAAWLRDELPTPTAAVAYGTGVGWVAALEAALLVKEIAQIPCEGVETREGATATMTYLSTESLVLSMPSVELDPLRDEDDTICRSFGAIVVEPPAGAYTDQRLAPIATFPAALALSVELALRRGLDPDRPAWSETYFATARRSNDV
jgi:glucosamine--fructose-6-phosphate aminotransferase (isomerizing)